MKEKASPFPVSSIEFDKVYRVMDKRKLSGYTERELSFLLGYRPLYVRDVENPIHTLRYTTKDTNYLLQIFECELSEIMPGKITEPFYQVKVEVKESGREVTYTVYQMITKTINLYREFTVTDQGPTSDSDFQMISKVEDFIEVLIDQTYFITPKTTLQLFKVCLEKFGNSIKPRYLSEALKKYTPLKAPNRLSAEKNESGRTVYYLDNSSL